MAKSPGLILAASGLVLVIAVWVISLADECTWHNTQTEIFIRRGAIRIEVLPAGAWMEPGDGWHLRRITYRVDLAWWPSYERGYKLPTTVNGMEVSFRTVFPTTIVIPFWLFAVPCLAVLLIAAIKRARRRPGHCLTCGYDLTGNVSGVCPECGRPTSPS